MASDLFFQGHFLDDLMNMVLPLEYVDLHRLLVFIQHRKECAEIIYFDLVSDEWAVLLGQGWSSERFHVVYAQEVVLEKENQERLRPVHSNLDYCAETLLVFQGEVIEEGEMLGSLDEVDGVKVSGG